MNVILTCKCGKQLRVGVEHAGKTIACRTCGTRLRVPSAPAVALPEDEEVRLQELPSMVAPSIASGATPSLDDDLEVKLQDLPASRVVAEPPSNPIDLDLETEDAAPTTGKTGYGLDGVNAGVDGSGGDRSSVAVIELASPASCLAYGCKGDWALAGLGSEALLINVKQKKLVSEFTEHTSTITALVLSPTEPLALSADEQGVLCYWQLAGSKLRQAISAHEGAIRSIALSTDATLALSGGVDGRVRLWGLASGQRRDLEQADWGKEQITSVQFSRDGSRVLAGGSQGNLSLWKADNGKRLRRFESLGQPIASVHFSDDGETVTAVTAPILSSVSTHIVVAHCETRTGELLNQFNIAIKSAPCCMTPDRSGASVIIGGGPDRWLGVWSLRHGRQLRVYEQLQGTPNALAVAPKNHRLLVALDGANLQLFALDRA